MGCVCLVPEAGKRSALPRGWREKQPVKADVTVPPPLEPHVKEQPWHLHGAVETAWVQL